jgi:hypothetical protein
VISSVAESGRVHADAVPIPVYVCRCGRVHLETRRLRLSISIDDLCTRAQVSAPVTTTPPLKRRAI